MYVRGDWRVTVSVRVCTNNVLDLAWQPECYKEEFFNYFLVMCFFIVILLAHLTLAAHRFWVKRWLEMSNVAHAFLLFVKFSAYVEDIVYRFPYYQRQSEIVEFILDALSFGLIERSCMWPLIAFFLSLFESPLKTKRKKTSVQNQYSVNCVCIISLSPFS